MAKLLNQPELEDLLNSEDEATDVQEVPVTICGRRGKFVVPDVGGWAYLQLGVFAIGYWAHDLNLNTERHVLIPYDKIDYLEFDYAALERHEASDA